jgi:fructan beta-fructosidase
MKKSLLLLIGVLAISPIIQAQSDLYKEKYRPQFHFTPAINWCNDPNGLMYYKGVYHLFYQHNPFGNVWGHMSWGHATSKDLLHWEHQPLAIPEENGVMIFSGTCVADENNTSGFAKEKGQVPFVAIYTGHTEGVNQSQHIAYSLDEGKTWTKYAGNPVIDLQQKDFRDPKVFWYAPKNYWVMAVMLPVEHKVQFYSSQNLKSWTLLSEFGPAGDTSGVWECPDLVEVPVENEKGKKAGKEKSKWLLQLSMNASMQYFVGSFDGVKFTNENPADKIYRPDYGPDYYAAITFGQLPKGHPPIAMGWINNWNYANEIPTTPWKGAMSLPRVLKLRRINNEWILVQQPVSKMEQLRTKRWTKDMKLPGSNEIKPLFQSRQCELYATMQANKEGVSAIRIAVSDTHYLEFGYDAAKKVLYADRSQTPDRQFHPAFAKMSRYEIPYEADSLLEFRVYIDNSIAEIFVDKGARVFTLQFFPDEKDTGFRFFGKPQSLVLPVYTIQELKTIW